MLRVVEPPWSVVHCSAASHNYFSCRGYACDPSDVSGAQWVRCDDNGQNAISSSLSRIASVAREDLTHNAIFIAK